MGNRNENVEKLAQWANERDGIVKQDDKPMQIRVIPYEEVARRLHERGKK